MAVCSSAHARLRVERGELGSIYIECLDCHSIMDIDEVPRYIISFIVDRLGGPDAFWGVIKPGMSVIVTRVEQ